MSRLIDVVDLLDGRGFPVGRRFKYACDGCGKDAFRSIRMNDRRVLCFECRKTYAKEKRLENKANTKSE